MVHPAGTVILTEASLGVEAVGKLGRTVGIAAGRTAGRIGATGTMEASWGVEAVGTTGRAGTMEASWGVEAVGTEGTTGEIAGETTAGTIEEAGTIKVFWGVEGIGTEGTTEGRIEGITGTGGITFVSTLTKRIVITLKKGWSLEKPASPSENLGLRVGELTTRNLSGVPDEYLGDDKQSSLRHRECTHCICDIVLHIASDGRFN